MTKKKKNRNIFILRKRIWKTNIAKIERHNQEAQLGYHTFYMAPHAHADLVKL